eukprot:scaffold34619_cov183-Amphora_coffeaeformis.AAC.5
MYIPNAKRSNILVQGYPVDWGRIERRKYRVTCWDFPRGRAFVDTFRRFVPNHERQGGLLTYKLTWMHTSKRLGADIAGSCLVVLQRGVWIRELGGGARGGSTVAQGTVLVEKTCRV